MTTDPLIGHLIQDQYLIESKLGAGGMGCVYQARNQKLGGRPCAIKVLLDEVGDSKLGKKRFEEEQKIISQLRSPHIVQVLDKGELKDGRLFIVMELLEGEPLSSLLKREGALPVKRVIPIIQGILAGLSEAHQHGIIHRDLKPANIFITRSVIGYEIAKVLDFGIAKSTGPNATELTQSQQIMGTPRYMTPEQFLQEPLTPRTDLYAAGLLFYEMLAGFPPFTIKSKAVPNEVKSLPEVVQLMWLHLNATPPGLPTPEPIWAIVESLLAKKQEDRPSEATEVIHDLGDLKELLESSTPSMELRWMGLPSTEPTAVEPSPVSGPHSTRSPTPSYPSAPQISALPPHLRTPPETYSPPVAFTYKKRLNRYVLIASAVALVGGLWLMVSPTPKSASRSKQVIKLSTPKVPSPPTGKTPKALVPPVKQGTSLALPEPKLAPQRPAPTAISAEVPKGDSTTHTVNPPEPVVKDKQGAQPEPTSSSQASASATKARKAKPNTRPPKRRPKRVQTAQRSSSTQTKRTQTKARSVSLKVLSRGMFFAPGSTLKLKATVNPRALTPKLRYFVKPSSAATAQGSTLRLSSHVKASTVRVKACVQSVCSLPIKIRVGLEDAPE